MSAILTQSLLFQKILDLSKECPNDMTLGTRVREIVNQHNKTQISYTLASSVEQNVEDTVIFKTLKKVVESIGFEIILNNSVITIAKKDLMNDAYVDFWTHEFTKEAIISELQVCLQDCEEQKIDKDVQEGYRLIHDTIIDALEKI